MAKKLKKRFQIDLWNYLDVNDLDRVLEPKMPKSQKGLPVNMEFIFVRVTKSGKLDIVAEYELAGSTEK